MLPVATPVQPRSQVQPCRTVLIVEDDADIRDTFRAILEDRGYCVATAGNGREALDRIAAERPCLVLLDLMMPVMSGPEFLDVVKQDPRLASIPIVVVSAYGEMLDDSAPAEGFLRKPVGLEMLLQWVARFCPRSGIS
jgi:CheY-like chemotaxis protein